MGNIIMQSQHYPLSVTFNVFRQMTISPKVSAIESQSKSLYVTSWDKISRMSQFCHMELNISVFRPHPVLQIGEN